MSVKIIDQCYTSHIHIPPLPCLSFPNPLPVSLSLSLSHIITLFFGFWMLLVLFPCVFAEPPLHEEGSIQM